MAGFDVIVAGAGIVGSAIGYGLVRRGLRVLLLDGTDTDFRAARANFGLVWVQGKGLKMPAYQRLTRQSSDLWPDFLTELSDGAGGAAIDYQRKGGLAFCLGEKDFEERQAKILRLHNQLGEGERDTEMLDRAALQSLVPGVAFGADVVGASYCWRDGHVNPLQLLAALHLALRRGGGTLLAGRSVERIGAAGNGFAVQTGSDTHNADRVVIAAGIATGRLARQIGLEVPIRPQRGQVLVTQRVAPFLPLPASGLRQTAEGTVMIGATQEEVGEDISTTAAAAARLAWKTTRIVPAVGGLQLVRQWAGLRIMSPDGHPIYAQSERFPGAFVALCHSGVTLAAAHAGPLAQAIAAGDLGTHFEPFHQRRFDVQAVA